MLEWSTGEKLRHWVSFLAGEEDLPRTGRLRRASRTLLQAAKMSHSWACEVYFPEPMAFLQSSRRTPAALPVIDSSTRTR